MSHLGDLIIEHGPLKPGDPDPLHSLTLGDFNALRDELIELRSEAADRHRANELSDRIAAELRLVTRERDALARRCAVRFEEAEALRAQLADRHSVDSGSSTSDQDARGFAPYSPAPSGQAGGA